LIRQRQAAAVLPLSDRQVRRLLRRYQREGRPGWSAAAKERRRERLRAAA
jgi:MarR-like DNA-binding transcriptional regulator SgrR of sgrS sRNA